MRMMPFPREKTGWDARSAHMIIRELGHMLDYEFMATETASSSAKRRKVDKPE